MTAMYTYYFTNSLEILEEDLVSVTSDKEIPMGTLAKCAYLLGIRRIVVKMENDSIPMGVYETSEHYSPSYSKNEVYEVVNTLRMLRMGDLKQRNMQEDAMSFIGVDDFERFQFLRAFNRTLHKYGRNICTEAYALVEGYLKGITSNVFIKVLKTFN